MVCPSFFQLKLLYYMQRMNLFLVTLLWEGEACVSETVVRRETAENTLRELGCLDSYKCLCS